MLDSVKSASGTVGELRAFAQDDNFRSRQVMEAVMTPEGVVFYLLVETVGDRAKETERRRTTVWRVDAGTGAKGEITGWAANAMAPSLSRDGRTLFFLASADLKSPPQIYGFDIATGQLSAITSVATGVTAYAVSPDGDQAVFATLDAGAQEKAPKDHIRISTLSYRFDPVPGYLQHARQALHVVPVDGSEAPRAITGFEGLIGSIKWSPAGDRFAYTVNGDAALDQWAALASLYVSDIAGERKRVADSRMIMSFAWAADARGIYFCGAPDGDLTKQGQLFVADIESGAVESLTPDLDRAVVPFFQVNSPAAGVMGRFLPVGGDVITSVGYGGEARICRISIDGKGKVEPLVSGPCIARPEALAGDRLLYVKQDALHPVELWLKDLDTGEDRQLTDHNSEWQAGIAWPELETLSVASGGGTTVEGWILKPTTVKAPYPAILYIHGGPHAAFGHGYCEDFMELVGAGYAVIFANPRGSTNYGDAFSTAIIGCWGNPEFEDFNALLDDLVARGVIDNDRLGVTGLSGGGHLTGWLMTHTDRFKAAVPEQGVYNMFSMYGVSDAGIALISKEMGGAPHEQPERYWELSPLAHAHKCRTPALLIQGENDIRCPMEQAEQLFTVLKHNGCEAELLRLRDCRHGTEIADVPSLRRLRMDAMKDWFARHIPAA